MIRIKLLHILTVVAIGCLSALDASADEPSASISHFAWGADVSSSIDVGGNDMSSINVDAYFGYRDRLIDMVGVGAGIHIMLNNSSRAFPVYALFRSNFREKPSLCFLDVRGGIAFDEAGNRTKVRPYANPGVGFNLAQGKTFRSYIIVGYLYNGFKADSGEVDGITAVDGLNEVNLRIGVTF